MNILEPESNEFTIYSKSGCPNCIKAKNFLKEKNIKFTIINCDEFILENKELFLETIQQITKKEQKTFPMIFDGKQFIGGLNDCIEHVNKILDFDVSF
jgi:glutaredoxin